MSDKTFKILTWIALSIITMFIAQYVILRTPLTLMITILWSIALVLYIHFKYSKVGDKERDRERKKMKRVKRHRGKDT